MIVVAWNYFIHNGPWRSDSLRSTTAVVTDVDAGRQSDGVSLTFTDASGSEVQADTRVRENSVRVGERLEVEYTEGQQPLVRVPGFWRPAYIVFGGYAAIALVGSLMYLCVHLVRARRSAAAR